ncbi:hypothetical protein CRM22_010441 [Opisthorchis felineus]|uniref:V-type proton ATPase subunit S1/VOA1 transmembrane domain-containing protein n=1 Tax=Opisthorchis felineus TaxID=147828 RepID=A0A4S2L406_OPIFE|nr:hypothetical protein CRM22_010441 [Opisthorchis felineus]
MGVGFLLLLLGASSVSCDITANVTYFNLTDCLAFIALKVALVNERTSEVIQLPNKMTLDTGSSSCGKDEAVLSFSTSNVEVSAMSISITFSSGSQRWTVNKSTVTISCTPDAKTCISVSNGQLDLGWLTAPSDVGFKCNAPPLSPVLLPDGSHTGVSLEFTWLQVQPFGAMGGRFGDATDCIRFFTIPIWSTLLVSFLLLGILTYGLQMLSAIRPNELYDDPKQKMVQLGTAN